MLAVSWSSRGASTQEIEPPTEDVCHLAAIHLNECAHYFCPVSGARIECSERLTVAAVTLEIECDEDFSELLLLRSCAQIASYNGLEGGATDAISEGDQDICQLSVEHYFDCWIAYCADNPDATLCYDDLESIKQEALQELTCDPTEAATAETLLEAPCDGLF